MNDFAATSGAGPPIRLLKDGVVLVDYGPMRMLIFVWERGRPLTDLAMEGARVAFKVVAELALFHGVIKKRTFELEIKRGYPDVVKRMIHATQEMGEPDLTPLAAVAGASSDVVADFIISRGGTKVIVDNGGDIAIRLKEGEVARVGIKTEIDAEKPSYVVSFDSTMCLGGVATSGLGGRSFTKGVASAATVVASNASLADAAATVIGNFTNVEDPLIVRSLAETLYPETDIPGQWVTTKVGKLSREKVGEALMKGLKKGEEISQKGSIKGAFIAVQGKAVWTRSLDSLLTRL